MPLTMIRHATRSALLLVGLFSTISAIEAAEPPGPAAASRVTCRFVAKPPVLDGNLDDDAWKHAEVIKTFPSFWNGRPSDESTQAMLVWDDDALYFAATMKDKELRAFGTKRNDALWNGDVFELFFKPSAEAPAYYEYQANPRSVILELAWPKRNDNFRRIASEPPTGMTAVARVEGTLDQPGDTDTSWRVEGKIPWSAFKLTGGKPQAGAAWLFALCRYDYGPEGTEPLLMSCAPLTMPSFHRYEDYGTLTFEAAK